MFTKKICSPISLNRFYANTVPKQNALLGSAMINPDGFLIQSWSAVNRDY